MRFPPSRNRFAIASTATDQKSNYPLTIVVADSTSGHPVPFHIAVEPSEGNSLSATSFIKCEQILTVSKERLIRRMGEVTVGIMAQVDQVIEQILALP